MRRTLLLAGIGLVTLASAATGVAASATTQAAHHRHPRGKFACEAWGANIGGTTFAVANKGYSPCRRKHGRVDKAGRTLGSTKAKVGGATANTELKGHRVIKAGSTMALASSRTAKVSINLAGKKALQIGVATSSATDRCVAGKGHKLSVKQSSTSRVLYIVLAGKKQKIGSKPMKISLGPLGTIYFNRVLRSGHTLTVRAVQIDLLGTKPTIILAQSQVGYTGNPCSTH